jgi:hypothetical protein
LKTPKTSFSFCARKAHVFNNRYHIWGFANIFPLDREASIMICL